MVGGGGVSHQSGMLGDLKWLLLSDLWVEILFRVTALAFPEKIYLLLSSAQPFPELLEVVCRAPRLPAVPSPHTHPWPVASIGKVLHHHHHQSQTLLPHQQGRVVKSHPWLASGHPTIISLSLPFKLQSTGRPGRGPGVKPSSYLFI